MKIRFKAAVIHSFFSMLLLLIALVLVFVLWYPDPLPEAMGVMHVYVLILIIDLVAGPLLTFIVFNPEKKELKRDLIIIVILQLAAYFYGLHTVAQGRPVWLVYVIDDIELVRAIDIDKGSEHQNPRYSERLFRGPQWVSAVYSSNEKIAQKQREDEMFEGISLATRPETYQPIENRSKEIEKKLKPVSELKKFNLDESINTALKGKKNIKGWLPVKGFEQDMVAIFDENQQPIAIVNLRPWD